MSWIMRHADHDPGLVCRPAFGHGLCEPLTESAWRTDEDADLSYPGRPDDDPRDAEYIGGYAPGLEDV